MIRVRHQKLKQISTGSVLKARLAYLYLRTRRSKAKTDINRVSFEGPSGVSLPSQKKIIQQQRPFNSFPEKGKKNRKL